MDTKHRLIKVSSIRSKGANSEPVYYTEWAHDPYKVAKDGNQLEPLTAPFWVGWTLVGEPVSADDQDNAKEYFRQHHQQMKALHARPGVRLVRVGKIIETADLLYWYQVTPLDGDKGHVNELSGGKHKSHGVFRTLLLAITARNNNRR